MKKYCFLFALASAMCACSSDVTPDSPASEKVSVTVNLQAPETKAYVQDGDDATLDKVQVMVFRKNGTLETTTDLVSSGSSIQMDINPGEKTIVAVGNLPVKCTPEDLEELMEMYYSLTANTTGKLLMSRIEPRTIKTSGVINLTLERLACKVVIDKIIRQFSEPAYDEIPLVVKRIYLSNAVTSCNLNGESPGNTGSFSVQKGVIGNLPATAKALLVDEGLNETLYDNDSHNVTHTFYTYPNSVTSDTQGGDTFTPRRTRLIVECQYNGQTCYYPITLPGMVNNNRGVLERNKIYRITTLTLTRPGAPNPDVPSGEVSSLQTCTFNISVEPWSSGHSITESFS